MTVCCGCSCDCDGDCVLYLAVIVTLMVTVCRGVAVDCVAGAAATGVEVEAPFSWRGLRGTVLLSQAGPGHNVTVTVDVTVLEPEAGGSYRLRVSQLPVDYTRSDYCGADTIGKP